MDLQIADWKLLQLTVDEVGPFRGGAQTFSFLGEPTDQEPNPGPSNLYMLLARNGHGKTTLLECVYGLMGLLADPPVGRFATPEPGGRAQLDVRATWTLGGKSQTVVLSIWTGTEEPLVVWTSDSLDAAQASDAWARLRMQASYKGVEPADGTDELGLHLYRAIVTARGKAPDGLLGGSEDMPTILYFPADRRISKPEDIRRVESPSAFAYQPAQCFASDGPEWGTTIDNLLVWLAWLEDDRLKELVKFVNDRLFGASSGKALREPRRQELLTYISTSTGEHPLVGLSHGERALLQLWIRIATHMTQNTVVLIDEVETHLHPNWTLELVESLKKLLVSIPSLSLVFTTHNRELMRVFNHSLPEPGLIKGGYLIDEEVG